MMERKPAALAPSERIRRLAWEKEHAGDADFFDAFKAEHGGMIPDSVGRPRMLEREAELAAMVAAWDEHARSLLLCPDAIR